jgi:hypothetical protein
MSFLWFWGFWHWSAEGAITGVLLRGPVHGIAGHWEEWYRHEALPEDVAAIARVTASPETQRAFLTWLVRHWVPLAVWKGAHPPIRFVLGQLAHIAPFDTWETLARYRNSYGISGVSAIVLAEGSDGEASDVRPAAALAIPRGSTSGSATVVAEGFSVAPTQLDTARAAVDSLLAGRGLLRLLGAWFVSGTRPVPQSVRAILAALWFLLCAMLITLLVGPDPRDTLGTWMAGLAALWTLLIIVEVSVCAQVALHTFRAGRQLRAHLRRSDIRLRMPGELRLVGGSAGLSFAVNVLLATLRSAPGETNKAWLWQHVFRALRNDAPRWAATGGIDADGRVLPVVLAPKIRALQQYDGIDHLLMPHQEGAPRELSASVPAARQRAPSSSTVTHLHASSARLGFADDRQHTLSSVQCRHLSHAVLAAAGLRSRTQGVVTAVTILASMVMMAAMPDLRSILAPEPAPMVVAPFSATPYALWVSLDAARPQDFWVVLESSFWSNRRAAVAYPDERGVGPARAELPLRRAMHQSSLLIDDGTVWIERRRRFLYREFEPGERVGQFSLSFLMRQAP